MTQGLKKALIRYGHEVEIVTVPFKFSPASYIEDLIEIWKKQDFTDFNGYYVDKVIALQFPAYYVKHPHKILWLMHQHRSVYELYNEQTASKELQNLRQKIHTADTLELSKIPKRFSMCQNISNRLKKFNGIDSTPLYHPPADEEEFYSQESYNYIFYPSRLEELKRQDLLIKAMSHTRSPVIAVIAGVGGQYENYKKLIQTLDLAHKVKLVGHITQEEKFSYYARSLGVFFAPFDEDYGYITLEAMLSSKPLITCSDSGGPLEFVLNNETGFVVDPNPQEIAQKIDFLYYNSKKTAQMGDNAKEYYLQKNISWDGVVQTLLN